MKTELESQMYLEEFKVTPHTAVQVGQFLQSMQRPITEYYPNYHKDAPILEYNHFVRWWHNALPRYKVGDKVTVVRESHKSTCVIEAIIHQDTKPIGCYCDIRNIDKGTIQRVNQNKLERV